MTNASTQTPWTHTSTATQTTAYAVFEAEDLTLTNYVAENNGAASGDTVVKLVSKDVGVASVRQVFDGEDGVYDLTLGYFDENDGAGTFTVYVDGKNVGSWVADNDNNSIAEQTLRNLSLETGQTIRVAGTYDAGERVRLDYLEFDGVIASAQTTTTATAKSAATVQAVTTANVTAVQTAAVASGTTRIESEYGDLSPFVSTNFSGASNGRVAELQGSMGWIRHKFTGDTDTYDLTLQYYDQAGVTGELGVYVAGKLIDSWKLNETSSGFQQVVLEDVSIKAGNYIQIRADEGNGETVKVDFLDWTTAGNTGTNSGGSVTTPTTGTTPVSAGGDGVRVQAEKMTLTNYESEYRSGATVAKLSANEGSAALSFNGASGTYDLTLRYLDESDGQSTLKVLVDGQNVGRVQLTADTDGFKQIVLNDIDIDRGDVITIEGNIEDGERARIDYIEFDKSDSSGSGNNTTSGGTTDNSTTGGGTTSSGTNLGTTSAKMFAPYAEWTLDNGSVSGNPYDVEATAIFTHSGTGETIRTGMFYNGDGTYSFRFSGTDDGKWTFRTQSSDSDLNGFTGTVNVAANANARGFVVSEDGKFAQQLGDGSLDAILPNYVMIEPDLSDYYNNPSKIENLIKTFIDGHGFTGVHLANIGGQFFDINNNTANNGSTIGNTATNPDPRAFEALENIITAVHDAGGVVHFWPWGDSSRNQTPDELAGGEMGAEHTRFLDYLADRLGPIPGWTMGYGFDNDEWTSPAQAAARTRYFDAQTDYDHLLGVRSEGPNSGTNHNSDVSWHTQQDFFDFEHHSPEYDVYLAAVEAANGDAVQSGDRFRIRGVEGDGYGGKDYTEEQTVDGLWHSTMAGGVANIWGNLTNLNTNQVVDRTGNFMSSLSYSTETQREITTWDRFFNDNDRFELDATEANWLSGGANDEQYALLSRDADTIVIYAEDTRQVDLNLKGLSGDNDWSNGARVIAVDTEGSYREVNMGSYDMINQTLQMSTTSDWALYVEAL